MSTQQFSPLLLKETGIYNYFKDIPKQALFLYMGILVLVVFLVSKIQPTFVHVIAILTALAILYFMNDRRSSLLDDYNKELELRMNTLLPKPEYFYIDPDIINIFYNIKEFRKYNQPVYDESIRATDNFLHIYRDIVELGVSTGCADNIEVAEGQYKLAINNLQSIVMTTPFTDVTMKKHQDSVDKLQITLRRHIDEMDKVCKKQMKSRRLTIYDKFYQNYQPKGDDTSDVTYEPHFSFH